MLEPVPWERADWFVVTETVRLSTFRRKKLTGPRAVRVPTMVDGVRHFAPVAVVTGSGGDTPTYTLYDATRPDAVLCTLTPEKGGARYRVTDERGTELGTAHRTPAAKRTIQHSWWLRPTGHPDVVARYHWSRGSVKDIAVRGKDMAVREAGRVVETAIDTALSFGVEDPGAGGRPGPARPVTWLADGAEEPLALTSGHVDGVTTYTHKASWLDRRLVFALGILREA
ncbi:hypothetical protein ACIQOU_21145 [Streptomyces sp. NPDC091279]|uniref:hypothetical protein n=1 Tax=unclassified Streptomyces TaxID=2593676 RepID=UPI003823CC43